MLGIILLFVMGKYFYKLAEKYEKSKWGYAILGIVTYYGVFFVAGIIYTLIFFMNNPLASEDDLSDWSITLICLPIGLGGAYLLYYLLEKNWRKNANKGRANIDDIGKGI